MAENELNPLHSIEADGVALEQVGFDAAQQESGNLTINDSTRSNYARNLSHFLFWMYNQTAEDSNYRELLYDNSVNRIELQKSDGTRDCTSASVKAVIDDMFADSIREPPFDIENFDKSIFTTYLSSLTKKDGTLYWYKIIILLYVLYVQNTNTRSFGLTP